MDRYGDTDWARGMSDEQFVKQLQRDLKKLGFAIVGRADGDFGRRTFWAVREFQIHASWAVTGKLSSSSGNLHERLQAQNATGHVYTGQISGVINADTRKLLEHWLHEGWHCPVIVNAWRLRADGSKRHIEQENVWLHNDLTTNTGNIGYFAHDVSGRFSNLSTMPDGSVRLGRYVKWRTFGGPRSTPPRFTDPAAEIFPENLAGKAFAQMSGAEKSTFRVVRSVADVECIGFFDGLNAYDNAFVSIGPCHHTFGIVTRTSTGNQVSFGELCGTLAHFEHKYPMGADEVLHAFGIRMLNSWVDASGQPTGALLFNRSQKKYTSWPAIPDDQGRFSALPLSEGDGNYFKSWHWMYRWTYATRANSDFQRNQWDLARIRLRDLSSLKLDVRGTVRTVGEVFTSEKALALLLRWHIRFPAHIARTDAGPVVMDAVARAMAQSVSGGWPNDPAQWTHRHERELVKAILSLAGDRSEGFQRTIKQVDDWPAWKSGPNPRRFRLSDGTSPLSERRDSFSLHRDGLPPEPWQQAGAFFGF